MIFNNLFFSNNPQKEQKLLEMEQQIKSLFENYHVAWNNFCDTISPTANIPKLTLSLKNSSIEDCFLEIVRADEILQQQLYNQFISVNPTNASLKKLYIFLDEVHSRHNAVKALNKFFTLGLDTMLSILAFKLSADFFKNNFAHKFTNPFTNPFAFGNAVAIFVLVDCILSFLDSACSYILLDVHIKRLQDVLSTLSSVMQESTTRIITLTQELKDGLVWLDKNHLLLLNSETSTPQLISLYNFDTI
ncbi:MAG: hypothetical protein ACRCSG_03870 [Cellulosilyticaceae bacterium]